MKSKKSTRNLIIIIALIVAAVWLGGNNTFLQSLSCSNSEPANLDELLVYGTENQKNFTISSSVSIPVGNITKTIPVYSAGTYEVFDVSSAGIDCVSYLNNLRQVNNVNYTFSAGREILNVGGLTYWCNYETTLVFRGITDTSREGALHDYMISFPTVCATPPIVPVNETVCTTDVKQCANGSYVSRVGPNCEFPVCAENLTIDYPTIPVTPVPIPPLETTPVITEPQRTSSIPISTILLGIGAIIAVAIIYVKFIRPNGGKRK